MFNLRTQNLQEIVQEIEKAHNCPEHQGTATLEEFEMLNNKVTTRWEGPQSLSYHKQWLGKDGLQYIQTYTSKQSYTARVQVDCAV